MGIIPITPDDRDKLNAEALQISRIADDPGMESSSAAEIYSQDEAADQTNDPTEETASSPRQSGEPEGAGAAPSSRVKFLPIDPQTEQLLALKLAAAAESQGLPAPPPRVEVTPIGEASSGIPAQLRLLVDFRGLAQQQTPESPSGESVNAPGASRPVASDQVVSAGRPEVGAHPEAGDSQNDPSLPPPIQGAAASTADSNGDSQAQPAPAEPQPRWVGEFLSQPGVDSTSMAGPALPLALQVTLHKPESLIAQAIRLAAPEMRKEFSEISDQKADDLLYFLAMEERRINPD